MNSKEIKSIMLRTEVDIKHYIKLLMETGMVIQEMFDEMMFAHHLNPDKVEQHDSVEIRAYMIDWAVEFEDNYKDDDRYENDFYEFAREFAEKKLTEMFTED